MRSTKKNEEDMSEKLVTKDALEALPAGSANEVMHLLTMSSLQESDVTIILKIHRKLRRQKQSLIILSVTKLYNTV